MNGRRLILDSMLVSFLSNLSINWIRQTCEQSDTQNVVIKFWNLWWHNRKQQVTEQRKTNIRYGSALRLHHLQEYQRTWTMPLLYQKSGRVDHDYGPLDGGETKKIEIWIVQSTSIGSPKLSHFCSLLQCCHWNTVDCQVAAWKIAESFTLHCKRCIARQTWVDQEYV